MLGRCIHLAWLYPGSGALGQTEAARELRAAYLTSTVHPMKHLRVFAAVALGSDPFAKVDVHLMSSKVTSKSRLIRACEAFSGQSMAASYE